MKSAFTRSRTARSSRSASSWAPRNPNRISLADVLRGPGEVPQYQAQDKVRFDKLFGIQQILPRWLRKGLRRGKNTQARAVPSENQIRTELWCSPAKMGMAAMVPYRWIARPSGASLCKDKCVRD